MNCRGLLSQSAAPDAWLSPLQTHMQRLPAFVTQISFGFGSAVSILSTLCTSHVRDFQLGNRTLDHVTDRVLDERHHLGFVEIVEGDFHPLDFDDND